MHGLPKDVDLSFLLNRTLLQVCIGENEAQMNFDGGVRLSVECGIRIVTSQAGERYCSLPAKAVEQLVELLGRQVAKASRTDDGAMLIAFDGGAHLTLSDENAHYESYNITYPGGQIVV